jgi:hypothetical protein
MSWLINVVAGGFGAKKLWDILDGCKAYMVGSATLLSGVAGLIQEFLKVEGSHNFAAMLTFAQGLPKDPMWLMILGGFGIIAAAHKADKVIAAVNTPAPTVTDPAPKP